MEEVSQGNDEVMAVKERGIAAKQSSFRGKGNQEILSLKADIETLQVTCTMFLSLSVITS